MSKFIYAPHPLTKACRPLTAVMFCQDAVWIGDYHDERPEHALTVGELADRTIITFTTPEPTAEFSDLRKLQFELPPELLKAVNRAKQLIMWQSNYRYCGHCGSGTVLDEKEPAFSCPACGTRFYPRLDPAVIVAITHEDKILLAHNQRFKNNMYGLIAGFVEGGESMEEAVQREIAEEIGIKVRNISYFQSQMWPFPQALMLGCFAEYESGEITPDGNEITAADFFTADNLPTLPSPGSVARRIIEHWLASQKK